MFLQKLKHTSAIVIASFLYVGVIVQQYKEMETLKEEAEKYLKRIETLEEQIEEKEQKINDQEQTIKKLEELGDPDHQLKELKEELERKYSTGSFSHVTCY